VAKSVCDGDQAPDSDGVAVLLTDPVEQGGFSWSSHHLDLEEVRWEHEDVEARLGGLAPWRSSCVSRSASPGFARSRRR
jgi:hypothetical protein